MIGKEIVNENKVGVGRHSACVAPLFPPRRIIGTFYITNLLPRSRSVAVRRPSSVVRIAARMMEDEDDPGVIELIDESSPVQMPMTAAVVSRYDPLPLDVDDKESRCSSEGGVKGGGSSASPPSTAAAAENDVVKGAGDGDGDGDGGTVPRSPPIRLTSGLIPRPKFRRFQTVLRGPQLRIRVLACSLGPRDAVAIAGNLPPGCRPNRFPFVPGTDICGVVEDVDVGGGAGPTPPAGARRPLAVGDVVVANTGRLPTGGLAECAVVDAARTSLVPEGIDPSIAAAAPSAGAAAVYAVDRVEPGDRVLVLGGSGGVGSCAVQLARMRGAAFVAATSRQRTLVRRLGADVVVNYFREDWWEKEEFTSDPFDVVIDCVGTAGSFGRAAAVLRGGTVGRKAGWFVDVAGDGSPGPPDLSNWLQNPSIRNRSVQLQNALYCGALLQLPRYHRVKTERTAAEIAMVLRLVRDDVLTVLLHNESSFPFTDDGVTEAFRVVRSGHAHGKVVVTVTERNDHPRRAAV